MTLEHEYMMKQLDLACLDTMHWDYSDYGLCLAFAWDSSCVAAVTQLCKAHGALPFEGRDPETEQEMFARWRHEEEQRRAREAAVAA